MFVISGSRIPTVFCLTQLHCIQRVAVLACYRAYGKPFVVRLMAESTEVPCAKRTRRNVPRYCGHCEKKVPSSTYYRHREKFFDVVSQRWQRDRGAAAQDKLHTSESSDDEIFEVHSAFQGIYIFMACCIIFNHEIAS